MSDSFKVELQATSVSAISSELMKAQTKIYAAMELVAKTVASKMEEWAKQNAHWTDQSSNARQGLRGNAYWENINTLVTYVAHAPEIDYGQWLELANERKYAILEKAINEYKDDLMAQWKKIVGD